MKTFWYAMTIACLVWYTVVTIYVAFKGVFDIKHMLASLGKNRDSEE